jgi:Flp pilus assembly pilin Flp
VRYIRKDEAGQGLAEYAFIVFLIAVVAIAALSFVSGGTNNLLHYITDNFPQPEGRPQRVETAPASRATIRRAHA